MTRTEIFERLKTVLQASLGDGTVNYDNINEQSTLIGDIGLNSVGILFVVVSIEEEFNLQFDNVGFGDFVTIKDVIDFIEKKVD